MIRAFFLSMALAAGAPAFAQQDAAPPPAQPTAPADSARAVAAIVETEFPAYDTNGDGQLDKAEFSRWMVVLKDQQMKATGQTLPPEQAAAWLSGAFTSADVDKNKSVSKAELIRYLSGGA